MNYQKLLKTPDLLEKLLLKFGVLENKELIINIDTSPVAEYSSSNWRDDADNYFKNAWNFSTHFKAITEFSIGSKRIYHYDDIKEAESELGMVLNGEDVESSLNLIRQVSDDYFADNGYDTDLNETFKLHDVKLVSINNFGKTILYEGGFFGNYESYITPDWGVYAEIEMTGVPNFLDHFFKELIGESYLLYRSGNFKMAYFIAYSALENYVNWNLNSEESEVRLKDKLKQCLKTKHDDLSRHEVYCGIIKLFDEFTISRNIIAHGREDLTINKNLAESVLLFVTLLTYSFDYALPSFEEIFGSLN